MVVMLPMPALRHFFLHFRILINHLKMRHHTRGGVLQYVTVIHPFTGAFVGHPGDFDTAFPGYVVSVFPSFKVDDFSIFFQHLEKETVQVERVVEHAGVRNFPYLQVAGPNWLVMQVHFIVDGKVDAVRPVSFAVQFDVTVHGRMAVSDGRDGLKNVRDIGHRSLGGAYL